MVHVFNCVVRLYRVVILFVYVYYIRYCLCYFVLLCCVVILLHCLVALFCAIALYCFVVVSFGFVAYVCQVELPGCRSLSFHFGMPICYMFPYLCVMTIFDVFVLCVCYMCVGPWRVNMLLLRVVYICVVTLFIYNLLSLFVYSCCVVPVVVYCFVFWWRLMVACLYY